MRLTRAILAMTLVAMLLVLPAGAWAKTKTVLGSVTITLSDGTTEPTGLVGFAVIANPGLEKTITQQVPPFTFPVFVDGDEEDGPGPGKKPFLNRRFDTTLVLTNTLATQLVITITVRGEAGVVRGTLTPLSIVPHGTTMVRLSDILD